MYYDVAKLKADVEDLQRQINAIGWEGFPPALKVEVGFREMFGERPKGSTWPGSSWKPKQPEKKEPPTWAKPI